MIKVTKKRLIILAAIVLVLVASATAFGIWRLQRAAEEASESTNQPSLTTQEYTTDPDLVDEVNQKYGNGDYSGAIDLIEGRKDAKDVGTQLLLAGAYANSGEIDKALGIYKEIDKAGQLPKTAIANMAEMAERAGDYKTALDAYKRAKEYAISSKTESQDQVGVYDYKISEMEKKL